MGRYIRSGWYSLIFNAKYIEKYYSRNFPQKFFKKKLEKNENFLKACENRLDKTHERWGVISARVGIASFSTLSILKNIIHEIFRKKFSRIFFGKVFREFFSRIFLANRIRYGFLWKRDYGGLLHRDYEPDSENHYPAHNPGAIIPHNPFCPKNPASNSTQYSWGNSRT